MALGWLRFPLVTTFTTASLTVIAAIARPTLALAPDEVAHPILEQVDQAPEMVALRRLQRQAMENLEAAEAPRFSQNAEVLAPYFTWSQITARINQRLTWEEAASARYVLAQELADQAQSAGSGPLDDLSIGALETLRDLWLAAIAELDRVAPQSSWAEPAAEKRRQYLLEVARVDQQLEVAQSEFLADIAVETGRPDAVRITLCHESGVCRNYQGDIPPASPASLIKLPIAVALLAQVEADNIDLNTQVYVDPFNWTENATGARIFVDEEYSLREIMVRMIRESNNIATNQLVDYIGWEAMNQIMVERGFPNIEINTKLAGDRTLPSVNNNSGGGPNRLTTNEVTEMMRQVYTFTHPGDGEILDALVGQYDWDFGYTAINRMRNSRVAWIGEKTGQNSRVIGTTLAVKVDDERYFMTVTLDNSGNQVMLRQVITEVVQHILDHGHLVAPESPILGS